MTEIILNLFFIVVFMTLMAVSVDMVRHPDFGVWGVLIILVSIYSIIHLSYNIAGIYNKL